MFPSKVLCEIASQPFKRAQTGLFQGKTKVYGNNVPFSKQKTRRTWLPNIQHKRLRSDILGEEIRVKLTTRALRTIHKKGGLDNYLMTTSAELLGEKGMELRMRVRAKKPIFKPVPPPENAITVFTGGVAEFAASAPSNTDVASKYNLWAARCARLLVGWRLGKGIAGASKTIKFYQGIQEPIKRAKPSNTSRSKVTPKHAPYLPNLLVQQEVQQIDAPKPIKKTQPQRSTGLTVI